MGHNDLTRKLKDMIVVASIKIKVFSLEEIEKHTKKPTEIRA